MKNNKIFTMIAAGVASMAIMSTASAYSYGPYFGGQLGWGNVHEKGIISGPQIMDLISEGEANSGTATNEDTGIAGRIYIGYQLTPYFAAELGYTRFSDTDSKATMNWTIGETDNSRASITTQAIDLVGKGIVPLQNGFSLYGKLGAAYIQAKAHVSDAVSGSFFTGNFAGSETFSAVYPTASVGVSYDVTPNLSTDLSYTRIQKVNSSSNDNIPSTDFVGLGLTYHFG